MQDQLAVTSSLVPGGQDEVNSLEASLRMHQCFKVETETSPAHAVIYTQEMMCAYDQ